MYLYVIYDPNVLHVQSIDKYIFKVFDVMMENELDWRIENTVQT